MNASTHRSASPTTRRTQIVAGFLVLVIVALAWELWHTRQQVRVIHAFLYAPVARSPQGADVTRADVVKAFVHVSLFPQPASPAVPAQ